MGMISSLILQGMRIDEPALDLGVISALASSMHERSISSTTVLCGEVGLAGEVRAIGHIEMRLAEAERLGFQRFIMAKGNRDRLAVKSSMELVGVASIAELMEQIFF